HVISKRPGRARRAADPPRPRPVDPDRGALLPLHPPEPPGGAADAVHPDGAVEGGVGVARALPPRPPDPPDPLPAAPPHPVRPAGRRHRRDRADPQLARDRRPAHVLRAARGQQHADRGRDGDRRRVRRRLDADRDRLPHRRPADPQVVSWLRHNPRLQIGLLLLAPFVWAPCAPGLLAPPSPASLGGTPFSHSSREFLLGTDEDGRDILSRLIFAARADLAISLSATLIAAVIGVFLGLAAGYRGG